MNNHSLMISQFDRRALLVRFLVNAVTLLVVVVLTPKVYARQGSSDDQGIIVSNLRWRTA